MILAMLTGFGLRWVALNHVGWFWIIFDGFVSRWVALDQIGWF